jgi:predicted esterase
MVRLLALYAAVVVVCAPGAGVARDWNAAVDELLTLPAGESPDALIAEIVDAGPDWREVAAVIERITFDDLDQKGVPILRTTVCADTVERPWVIVVPEGYDPGRPTPLLVVLHGAVGRTSLIEDPLAHALENEFAALAQEMGWLALVPFGQDGATWWDDVGMANIRDLVRTLKIEFNVDDDRVWMIGFSDGASAGFAHAMVTPSDYAAFVALNGHIGVGSLDGELPTYAPNLANTPMYVTTTFDDGLYPSDRMRPTIEMARAVGGDIFYRELPGEHDFADVAGDIPAVARFLGRHARDPFPPRITWEATSRKFGACRWFLIDEVTNDDAAPWHTDHNSSLVDDRITVGFHPDWEFEGTGVRVDGLADSDAPAARMGLKEGDVIVAAGAAAIDSLAALDQWKGGVARGDEFDLTVARGDERVTLHGQFPETSNYFVFKRDAPSAKAVASFAANTIDIEASRLGAFSILVHPDMVRLDEPLTIRVDGETVHEDVVRPDIEFMLRNFFEERDRRLLYVAKVAVDLD